MNSSDKVFLCLSGMIATVLIVAFVLVNLDARNSRPAEIEKARLEAEKVANCAKAGFEWRPLMLPGSSTQTMSCVKPNGGN